MKKFKDILPLISIIFICNLMKYHELLTLMESQNPMIPYVIGTLIVSISESIIAFILGYFAMSLILFLFRKYIKFKESE